MSTRGDAVSERRRWRWPARIAVIVLAAAAVGVTVRGRLPAPAAIWTILRTADARWVAAALAAQVMSQAAFGFQQRRLLGAAGVRVSRIGMLAITYSRSAISLALPAGSAMSAAYAVQQYRRRGAAGATAATVTVLSMVASMSGLLAVCVLTYGQGAVAGWWHSASYEAIAAAAVLVAALVTAVRSRPRTRKSVDLDLRQPGGERLAGAASRPSGGAQHFSGGGQHLSGGASHFSGGAQHLSGGASHFSGGAQHLSGGASHFSGRGGHAARNAVRRFRARAHREWTAAVTAARSIRPWDGVAAVLWSALNWAADAFCLIAAAQACGLPVSWRTVGAAYLVAQVVRQIPLSPGGLGFVEASLVTALSMGASPAVAAAAVLLYRIVSFWLILPVGLITYLGLRQVPARPLDFPVASPLSHPAPAVLAESTR
ncbi:YbhN family protein [Actinoplanes sp. NPDC020271]|uniref:YbhN family protein n=1 Tax=Actinoplanes sp. NPDC020271 TaxID=3363896 RepID=UPI003795483A